MISLRWQVVVVAIALVQPQASAQEILRLTGTESAEKLERTFAESSAAYVLVTKTDNLDTIRKAASKHGKLVVLEATSDPVAGIQAMERLPGQVIIYHDMPASLSQASAIHGHSEAAAKYHHQDIEALRQQLASGAPAGVSIVDLSTKASPSAELQAALLRSNPSDISIVIGHVAGTVLKLHDGEGVNLQNIQLPGRLWVVGCNTATRMTIRKGFAGGTTRNMTYASAISLAKVVSLHVGRCMAEGLLTEKNPMRSEMLRLQADQGARFAVGMVGVALVFLPLEAADHDRN